MTTPNQLLNELRDEIKELDRIIRSPIEQEHRKLRARNRLRIVGEQLLELREQMKQASADVIKTYQYISEEDLNEAVK